MILVYGTEAPSRTLSSPTSHSYRSPTRLRSRRYSGRRWSKLISTITSVPPAIGTAVGCSAFAASASFQLAGRRKSMTGSLLRLVVVQIEPTRVRRTRLVQVLLTRSGLSTPPRAPRGSVTETMKELAGQRGHLVDSYERRSSVTPSFCCGNSGSSPKAADMVGRPHLRASPKIHRRFLDKKRRRRNAAARTAGHRRAGPQAARRRGGAGPHRPRRHAPRPASPQPLPLGR